MYLYIFYEMSIAYVNDQINLPHSSIPTTYNMKFIRVSLSSFGII